MGKLGNGYGSEYHLLSYFRTQQESLETHIGKAVGLDGPIEWFYPGALATEPKDLTLIPLTHFQLKQWNEFWPVRGNRSWDGVAKINGEWIFIEAKANSGEFRTSACGAGEPARTTILKALHEVKTYMGADPRLAWEQTYYQYANRLAVVYFLNERVGIPARLLNIYFSGDVFPDGRECPSCESDWLYLIRECYAALGIRHDSPGMHRV